MGSRVSLGILQEKISIYCSLGLNYVCSVYRKKMIGTNSEIPRKHFGVWGIEDNLKIF
jgi:hypothetical protein